MLVRNSRSIEDHPTSRSPLPRNFMGTVNWEGFSTFPTLFLWSTYLLIWRADMLAFTFASPLLVYPLYISRLVPPSNASPTAPKQRRIPYPFHTLVASLLSVLLLTPYLLILPDSARPNPILRSISILSGIPPLWILALVPRLPAPSPSSSTSPGFARGKYKYALWALITLVSVLIPPSTSFMRGLQRVLILCVLFTTYLLPALLHIALHMLLPPLAILVGVSDEQDDRDRNGDRGGEETTNLTSDADTLLRRKERSLQRRRLGRRIVWDLSVWILLLPLGLVMTAWSGGRVFGIW